VFSPPRSDGLKTFENPIQENQEIMRSLTSERDAATRQLEKEAELTRRVKEEYAQTLLEMQV
jgi:hypothetical protein